MRMVKMLQKTLGLGEPGVGCGTSFGIREEAARPPGLLTPALALLMVCQKRGWGRAASRNLIEQNHGAPDKRSSLPVVTRH